VIAGGGSGNTIGKVLSEFSGLRKPCGEVYPQRAFLFVGHGRLAIEAFHGIKEVVAYKKNPLLRE